MPHRARVPFAALLLALLAIAPRLSQAEEAVGVKPEMMMWFKDAEEKLVQLSDAIPESKYSWRPGKGVRSVGEVYMHVATTNYGFPGLLGTGTPPEGFNFETYEKTFTKKADIRKTLKDSFKSMEESFEKLSDADLDKPAEFFGMKTTVRGGYLLLLSHCHEHLGQSIAYARTNGIVPPWTARQQAAMEKQHDKGKDKDKKDSSASK